MKNLGQGQIPLFTFGLIHCQDYPCAMRASRIADEIDLKGPGFCRVYAKILATRQNLG